MIINQDKSGLFKALEPGKPDRLAVVFKWIGVISFTTAVPLILLVDEKKVQSRLLGAALITFYFLGPIMLILYVARVRGAKKGIKGVGKQLWATTRPAILYFLLPMFLLAIALTAYSLYAYPR